MRKIEFHQNENNQKVIVKFGLASIASRCTIDKNLSCIELAECVNPVTDKINAVSVEKYSDRFVKFEFNNVESIETVIGWLGDLRNEFIKMKENERK